MRTLALGGLGVVSLVIGGLALRSSTQSAVLLDVKDALIAGQSALIEFDSGERRGHLDGDGPPGDNRRTGDAAKVAMLARTAAGKVSHAGKLLGTAGRPGGLDVTATVAEMNEVATRVTTAKPSSKDWQDLRDKLAVQVDAIEDAEAQVDADDDPSEGTEEEAADSSWYEPSFLGGVFAFVFLNFGLLVVQTLRSKETPKIVLDTLTMSASFLIGAGTSNWVS